MFKNTCWLGTEIGWITAVVTPDFGVEDPIVKETEVVFFWALKNKKPGITLSDLKWECVGLQYASHLLLSTYLNMSLSAEKINMNDEDQDGQTKLE